MEFVYGGVAEGRRFDFLSSERQGICMFLIVFAKFKVNAYFLSIEVGYQHFYKLIGVSVDEIDAFRT